MCVDTCRCMWHYPALLVDPSGNPVCVYKCLRAVQCKILSLMPKWTSFVPPIVDPCLGNLGIGQDLQLQQDLEELRVLPGSLPGLGAS